MSSLSWHPPLHELAALADEARASSVAQDARELLKRLEEGRFYVACVGQFKRGKSTLINALLGQGVLPTGVAPVTSVVTVVRFGEARARIRVGLGDWHEVAIEQLAEYVAESQNPENKKGVSGVEVFCRSDFLERGLCLVDTPGIGSTLLGNTAETLAFVPQIDAAIVVLGGDPPISDDELELVKRIASSVPSLLFVLNKADRLSETERQEAIAFTHRVLSERARIKDAELFQLSSLERLQGSGPERDWPALRRRLDELAGVGGGELLARAAERGFDGLNERLQRQLREERNALLWPVEESEHRLAVLRRCVIDAQQAATELHYLFDAEQQRLASVFAHERERFLREVTPAVTQQLEAELAAPLTRGPRLRRRALERAQDVAESAVRSWLERERPRVEHEFAAATERFVEHANGFLDRLAAAGHLPPDALPSKLAPETGLRARGHYYFASLTTQASSPLWLWLIDWCRSRENAQASVRKASSAFAERLLQVNTSRVLGDFTERIVESRRTVEGMLRRTLLELVETAEASVQRASEVQRSGATAVAAQVALLDDRLTRLEVLVNAKTALCTPATGLNKP